ncbi:MAG: hypothetical protein ACOYMA_01790 [Bacteroidia bacterium]
MKLSSEDKLLLLSVVKLHPSAIEQENIMENNVWQFLQQWTLNPSQNNRGVLYY